MYSKRHLITKIDRSKLRRSVPRMDYNIMAKGKKKLLRKRKHDVKISVTNDMKRRKFEGSNIQKIKKMVLLGSGKNISSAISISASARPKETEITSSKQFLHKQKYKHYIKINEKCPLMCSEGLPDNSSVHTRSMTRQHSFIGSIYNKVLYNEELKINGQDTRRDRTQLPLWPEGDKTVNNMMLDSLNLVLQFCSTYQRYDNDKKEVVAMPVQSQNKINKNCFAREVKYKQLNKLKVSDHKNASEWKIDENGLEYKMIKISLPSDSSNNLNSDDDVFVKPQDPSYYKALNKNYVKTVKKCKGKDESNSPDVLISPSVDVLRNSDNETKSSDSTIIVIDDDDDDDDAKEAELDDSDVSQKLYNMILSTSQLYCMLCSVPVTEVISYINNFRPAPI